MKNLLKKILTTEQKLSVKSRVNKLRKILINTFKGYDADALKKALAKAGVKETDTLFVHANFNPESGFKGAPLDMVKAFSELVGEKGNLLMVSIPFRGTAYDYLAKYKTFNVKKTISMMGLVTEMFRRKKGVLRSLHPTHPVLALGKDKKWIVEGHEKCPTPCGVGTPFDKFRQLKGKILFFDVYNDTPFSVKVIDIEKNEQEVSTYAFSKNVRREALKLEAEMIKAGKLKKGRVGNSDFILVAAEDVVDCQTSMIKAGNLPYEVLPEGQTVDED
jgi:aminoglycoside 3-N-acetyltransferase